MYTLWDVTAEIKSLNSSTIKDIETVVKHLPTKMRLDNMNSYKNVFL